MQKDGTTYEVYAIVRQMGGVELTDLAGVFRVKAEAIELADEMLAKGSPEVHVVEFRRRTVRRNCERKRRL